MAGQLSRALVIKNLSTALMVVAGALVAIAGVAGAPAIGPATGIILGGLIAAGGFVLRAA